MGTSAQRVIAHVVAELRPQLRARFLTNQHVLNNAARMFRPMKESFACAITPAIASATDPNGLP